MILKFFTIDSATRFEKLCCKRTCVYEISVTDGFRMVFPYGRVDFRLASNQWETSLQSNAVSHWLGANLESALYGNGALMCHFPQPQYVMRSSCKHKLNVERAHTTKTSTRDIVKTTGWLWYRWFSFWWHVYPWPSVKVSDIYHVVCMELWEMLYFTIFEVVWNWKSHDDDIS